MGMSTTSVVVVVLLVGVLAFAAAGGLGNLQMPQASVTLGPQGQTVDFVCESSTAPTLTALTPDYYGGAAVTTQNMYRLKDGGTWTDIAGAGTDSTVSVGDELEIIFGIDTNDDDAEPYGRYISSYIVPCDTDPKISAAVLSCDKLGKCGVIDDSVAGDLAVIALDPEDGNSITSTDAIDLDAGDIKTISTTWTGAFEEDFGNRFCEDFGDSTGAKHGNVIVISYNTTQYDEWYVTSSTTGQRYPAANVNINRLLSATSGYTDVVFEVPVLRSNADWEFNMVADVDDSVDADGGESNVTVRLYDVNYYEDNDVTPSAIKCGIMDEDAGEVGAAAADSLTLVITDD